MEKSRNCIARSHKYIRRNVIRITPFRREIKNRVYLKKQVTRIIGGSPLPMEFIHAAFFLLRARRRNRSLARARARSRLINGPISRRINSTV